jgi:hypothetical protein
MSLDVSGNPQPPSLPCTRSPADELESAALGDPAERTALAQTWNILSELLATHDALATGTAASHSTRDGSDSQLAVQPSGGDRWAMAFERRLRAREQRRRVARPLALAASLALSATIIAGLLWVEQRSQRTMARLERFRLPAQLAISAAAAPTTDSLPALWNDELDSQLSMAREQIDSLQSFWNSPDEKLGQQFGAPADQHRNSQEVWNEDTL